MTDIFRQINQINRKASWQSRGFLLIFFLGITALLFSTSCQQSYSPKPKAYPRITYPEADVIRTKNLPFPVYFEYPAFARMDRPIKKATGEYWLNFWFENFKATLFTAYIVTDEKEIQQHLFNNEALLKKEAPLHACIQKKEFESNDSTIQGYLYIIDGNTACPVQFILTDKHKQLFRGALYFNYIPNRDSIKDIVNGLTGDIQYLMESFRFKK